MSKRLEDLAAELKTSIPDTGILAISYEENGSRVGFLDLATKNVQEVGIGVHPRWDTDGSLWFARESAIVHLDDKTREIPVATFEHEILDVQPTQIGVYVATNHVSKKGSTVEYWLLQNGKPVRLHTALIEKRTGQLWTITDDGHKIAVPYTKKEGDMFWRVYFPAENTQPTEIKQTDDDGCFLFFSDGLALAESYTTRISTYRKVFAFETKPSTPRSSPPFMMTDFLRKLRDKDEDKGQEGFDLPSVLPTIPISTSRFEETEITSHKVLFRSPIASGTKYDSGSITLARDGILLRIDAQQRTLDYVTDGCIYRRDLVLQIEKSVPCDSLMESAIRKELAVPHLVAFTQQGVYFPKWADNLTIVMQGSFETGNANGLCALNYPVTELKVRPNA